MQILLLIVIIIVNIVECKIYYFFVSLIHCIIFIEVKNYYYKTYKL